MRTDEVAFGEGELARADAFLAPGLEQLELEGDARRGVFGGGERPHAERVALLVVREARVRAVRPTALGANGAHHARREGAAEDGGGDVQGDVIVVARMAAHFAEEDLRLRPLGFVDEDEPALAVACGRRELQGRRPPTGQRGEQTLGELRGARLRSRRRQRRWRCCRA